ncbi:MAG TPA: MATE family efflux transporter, partial [bacterium]|nr:MATE family efflux transporter [bacterium]
CLIFGVGGLPALGIAGSAIATVIANIVVCAVLLARFLSRPYAAAYQTRAAWRPDRTVLAKLLRYGLPAGLQNLLDLSSFTAFIFIIGRNGTIEQMTGNILLSINSILFLPMLGLGTATATLVGQSLGAERKAAAMRYAYRALHLGWLFQTAGALFLLGFPRLMLGLFRGDTMPDAVFAQVLAFGTAIIPVIVLYNLFDAASVVITGALRGSGDTIFPAVTAIITAWFFFVPLTWLVVGVLRHTIVWAFACLAVYVVILMLVLWLRFRAGTWRHRRLLT